jgi:hypothetical protein
VSVPPKIVNPALFISFLTTVALFSSNATWSSTCFDILCKICLKAFEETRNSCLSYACLLLSPTISSLWQGRHSTGERHVPFQGRCMLEIFHFPRESTDSSVCKANYGLDDLGSISGRHKLFLFSINSKTRSDAHSASHTMYSRGSSWELKQQKRETNDSHSSSIEVTNGAAIPPLLHTSSWCELTNL